MDNEVLLSLQKLFQAQQSPQGQKPFLILHQDQKVEDIESTLNHPVRKIGNPEFVRSQSFVTYINEHKTDSSRIYAVSNTSFIAVLDHHGKDPAWGQHRATLNLRLSSEWLLWNGSDKKKFGQREFGTLIEDNLVDVVAPVSAELLEMVRQFEATSTVEFKSAERDDRGNIALSYVQTIVSRAGQKGQVELPKSFTLRIPAFEGEDPMPLVAKLRFDIGGGKLVLWYELQRVQKILQDHTDLMIDSLSEKTEIEPFYGTP